MATGTHSKKPHKAAASGKRKANTARTGTTIRKANARKAPARKALHTTPAAAPRVTPDRVAYLVGTFGKTQLADLAGVHRAQPARWMAGTDQPREAAGFLLDLEHALAKARLAFGEQAAKDWLLGNNSYLGGARPIDVLKANGSGAVMDALDGELWGSYA